MSDSSGAGGGLTVGRAAAHVGVTVRTLHHWDDVGLVRPSLRNAKGYRLYDGTDLARIQRVLVYRELDLSLDAIATLLDDGGDPTAALREQRRLVHERLAKLESMAIGLDRMIRAHESGVLLTVEQQAEIFGPGWRPEWLAGARARWGDTAQWAQYAEQAAHRGPAEWQAITDRMARLDADLAEAMASGVAPGSDEADALARRHRETFAAYFPITREMQVCLARMYDDEPAFTTYYDDIAPGLTVWFRSVVESEARHHGIDPDTAQWR